MLPRCRFSACLRGLVLLAIAIPAANALQITSLLVKPTPVLVADGLGKGAIALDGRWQFHIGDDMAWANPSFDDSRWEQLSADKPWGTQGHFAYAGFAWYRLTMNLTPAPGAPPDVALFVPQIDDAYQIYWNGQLVGSRGHMPPRPVWFLYSPAQTFGLGPARRGILAVRVWKVLPSSRSSGLEGGIAAPIEIGSPQAVEALKAQVDYEWLRSRALFIGLYSLFGLLGILGFGLWLRDRSQTLMLWAAIYFADIFIEVVLGTGFFTLPAHIAVASLQIITPAVNISLWYLTCWLLDLRNNRNLMRATRVAATTLITVALLNALGAFFLWPSRYVLICQISDAILTSVITALNLWNLVPVAVAVFGHRKLDPSRWLFACATTFSSTLYVAYLAVAQGKRFTHWHFDQTMWAPVFHILGSAVNLQTMADSFVLVSLVYAIYRSAQETSSRKAALEQEFQNARELQQVLIPESIPDIPGFSLTSAYKPALEVGGDFFQIIPIANGETLIVLGDVSGKGLRAAMAVSLIVGMVRALANMIPDPGKLLTEVNERLVGRLQGGFATAIALQLNADGNCELACAGHLAPFANDKELNLPGAFPLGVACGVLYDTIHFQLRESERLALFTDGLLEARNQNGELYGFGRLLDLFAAKPDARQATQAAIDFGQDDDITVLILTRLGVGDESGAQCTRIILSPA